MKVLQVGLPFENLIINIYSKIVLFISSEPTIVLNGFFVLNTRIGEAQSYDGRISIVRFINKFDNLVNTTSKRAVIHEVETESDDGGDLVKSSVRSEKKNSTISRFNKW